MTLNIGCLLVSAENDKQAYARAKELADYLPSRIDEAAEDELLPGPVRAPVSRLRNRYRWRIIVKCGSEERLAAILADADAEFNRKGRKQAGVELSTDINPVNMM